MGQAVRYVNEKFQWRNRESIACSAVPQPTTPPRAPLISCDEGI